MVVPHENRTDTWFLRFTNLESDEWRGGEIVAWIVFDYVPDRGKGTSKPLATFPDKPPLFGVLTPTGVFTPQTGAKWVCLPGLAQGFGNEELVWQTVYSGQLPGSHPRYNFDLVAGGHAVRVTSANPKNVHFKGGSALPVLDGSMVNYVRVLLDQFDSPGGWYKLATIGADEHVDGMHDRSVLAANVANGTTGAMLRDAARWNEEHLGPLMEKFREADASLQGAAPPPPPPPAPPLPAGTGPPLEGGGGGGGGAEGLPPGSGSESAVIKREIEEAVQQIETAVKQEVKPEGSSPPSAAETSRPSRKRARAVRSEPESEQLFGVAPGARVRTVGLEQEKYNSLEGVAVRLYADGEAQGRWRVECDSGEKLAIKAANLETLRPAAPPPASYGYAVVGTRVSVLWDARERPQWYAGRVADFSAITGKHLVRYDDTDQKWHDLRDDERHGQLRWL